MGEAGALWERLGHCRRGWGIVGEVGALWERLGHCGGCKGIHLCVIFQNRHPCEHSSNTLVRRDGERERENLKVPGVERVCAHFWGGVGGCEHIHICVVCIGGRSSAHENLA